MIFLSSRRLVAFLLFASALVLALVGGGFEKPDFSGTWALNLEKTRLQSIRGLESGEIVIEHAEPRFRFDRAFAIKGKTDSTSWQLTTDGREAAVDEGGITRKSRLFWDGDTLVLDELLTAKGGEATNRVRYRLRDGGRTLVAEEQFRGSRLSYDNLWVADKRDP